MYFKILLFVLIVTFNSVKGQQLYSMQYQFSYSDSVEWNNSLVKPVLQSDSLGCLDAVKQLINQLNQRSFLAAKIKSIVFIDTLCKVHIDVGQSYRWLKLNSTNISKDVLTATGYRSDVFTNKKVDLSQYVNRVQKMLGYLEQSGYPFAQFRLDSIQVMDDKVSANLMLDKGDLIRFDTIEIIGDAMVKGWMIAKYLGIKKDNPYNEQLLAKADARLSQLPFLQVTRPAFVYFVGATAKPVFYLANRKSSSVDGIIGFAPSSDANAQKLLITGELNLRLQNLISTAKQVDLSYKSFLSGSQDLRLKTVWPYLFRTSLGLDYELNLLRFDSTYLDVKHDFGFQYRIIGTDYIKVFYSIQTTSLLRVDTLQIRQSKTLPIVNDVVIQSYGGALKRTQLDYYLNPRKGYSFELNASLGNKQIVKNATINEVKFLSPEGKWQSVYDTLKLNTLQYRLVLRAEWFLPITERTVWRNEINVGYVKSDNLFFSDLFRLGGIRTLKGFDEQAIFAERYGIINSEIRYLLQQNSNAMIFWNGAWYQNKIQQLTDKPYGIGAGVNFETGAGIFSLYYAVGKQFNNELAFNKAKIHFGFVNYF